MRRPNPEIREFILRNVKAHSSDITAVTAEKFKVSRMTVTKYLGRLIEEGWLVATGERKGRRYSLRRIVSVFDRVQLEEGMDDDTIWRENIRPVMKDVPENIIEICEYGFTEMFNNVIDHSGSKQCMYWYHQDYLEINLGVRDYGIGIFEKIRGHFNLIDRRHALLELSKGKLTSFPERHSGEGIFFTSRAFDDFAIDSRDLFYTRSQRQGHDHLIEVSESDGHIDGTAIHMKISLTETRRIQDVFVAHMDDDFGFSKTHVPLTLARTGEETFVSRSQAKRVLARVDKFSEVFLDFAGVKSIGQAFADEIFRVYKREHPQIEIIWVNANDDVERMIKHAMANAKT